MSNNYSLYIFAADDCRRKVFAADDSGLTRTVRKSPLSSAAIMKVFTSILFTLCIIPTNAQQRTYSINQLKKHTWTETLTTFEEKSVDTLCFTDKEMISSRRLPSTISIRSSLLSPLLQLKIEKRSSTFVKRQVPSLERFPPSTSLPAVM